MEEVTLQVVATLLIGIQGGVCLALYVGDGRALAPSEGLELGLLGFSGQGVYKSLEMPCAFYDTVLGIMLSIVSHGDYPRNEQTGLITWTKVLVEV